VETQIYRAVKKLKAVLSEQPGPCKKDEDANDRPGPHSSGDPSATSLPGEVLLLLGVLSLLS
jgi:hypothetical protein